jgi:hypothetical protein
VTISGVVSIGLSILSFTKDFTNDQLIDVSAFVVTYQLIEHLLELILCFIDSLG